MKTPGNTVINGRAVPSIGFRSSRRATPTRVARIAQAYGRSRSSSEVGPCGGSDGEPVGLVIAYQINVPGTSRETGIRTASQNTQSHDSKTGPAGGSHPLS